MTQLYKNGAPAPAKYYGNNISYCDKTTPAATANSPESDLGAKRSRYKQATSTAIFSNTAFLKLAVEQIEKTSPRYRLTKTGFANSRTRTNLLGIQRAAIGPKLQGKGKSLAHCGRLASWHNESGEIDLTGGSVSGVMWCDSPNCIVCGARRDQLLQQYIIDHAIPAAIERGCWASFVTRTIQHTETESAETVRERLTVAKKLYSNRLNSFAKRQGIEIAAIWATETKFGQSGYHYHHHDFVFSSKPAHWKLSIAGGRGREARETTLGAEMQRIWLQAVADAGGYASEKHGFLLESVALGNGTQDAEAVARYMTKAASAGWEVAGQSAKSADLRSESLSSVDLLVVAASGGKLGEQAAQIAAEIIQADAGKQRVGVGELSKKWGLPRLSDIEKTTEPRGVDAQTGELADRVKVTSDDWRVLCDKRRGCDAAMQQAVKGQTRTDRLVNYVYRLAGRTKAVDFAKYAKAAPVYVNLENGKQMKFSMCSEVPAGYELKTKLDFESESF